MRTRFTAQPAKAPYRMFIIAQLTPGVNGFLCFLSQLTLAPEPSSRKTRRLWHPRIAMGANGQQDRYTAVLGHGRAAQVGRGHVRRQAGGDDFDAAARIARRGQRCPDSQWKGCAQGLHQRMIGQGLAAR